MSPRFMHRPEILAKLGIFCYSSAMPHPAPSPTSSSPRLLGPRLALLARRLELREALPGPPWLLPDPDLSETLRRVKIPPFPTRYGALTAYRDWLKTLAALHRTAGGRARLPNRLRHAWP